MPRYYRRRTTRVVKPKKKWASNIRAISFDTGETAIAANDIGAVQVLCANSAETDFGNVVAPTPTIVKTGNFKVQCDAHIVTSTSAFIRLMMYIIYIPEGVFIASDAETAKGRYEADWASLSGIVQRHPEWILAWRQFSSDFLNSSTNLDRVSFSSRLKRNLNSGDQICAVFIATRDTQSGPSSPISRVLVNGTCQFWTCAN